MRRIIQCSVLVFLSTCSIYAFAGGFDYTKEDLSGYNSQPNFKVNGGSSGVSRDGNAVYFFGGYVYTNRFLDSGTKTIFDPINNITYPYTPKTLFPNVYNGLEIGIGKELTRYINVEMAYNQQFVAKKTGTAFGNSYSTSVKMNGVLLDAGFVFNPDDPFQVMGKLGVQLSQFNNSVSINNSSSFTFSDSTKIDPALGLEFLYQFNRNVGLRLDTMYVANTQSSNSSGEANIMLGLNYTL